MKATLGILAFIIFLSFGAAQIYAGALGINLYLGAICAGLAVFAAFALRFTLPITIGAFFGAMDVWHWHWALAALFALPGLVFVIPGMIAMIISFVKR